jgi:hypothetical protein
MAYHSVVSISLGIRLIAGNGVLTLLNLASWNLFSSKIACRRLPGRKKIRLLLKSWHRQFQLVAT